jgi:DNA-binding PadR family transcriptional regulator
MREPKIYGPYSARGGRSTYEVTWYDADGVRQRRQIADAGVAKLAYEQKLAEFENRPANAQVLLHRQLSVIQQALGELLKREDSQAAEARELRDKVQLLEARLAEQRPAVRSDRNQPQPPQPTGEAAVAQGFRARVLVIRPETVELVRSLRPRLPSTMARNIALVVDQLRYLIANQSGKVLNDGLRYVYGTYLELQQSNFRTWSPRTVERVLTAAEAEGFILSRQPEGRLSRRKYYTLTREAAKMADSARRSAECSRQPGGLKDAATLAGCNGTENQNSTRAAAAAAESDEEWLKRLANEHGFDETREWHRYLEWTKKRDLPPTRDRFEKSHIPRIELAAKPGIKRAADISEPTPPEWEQWFASQNYRDREGQPQKCPSWQQVSSDPVLRTLRDDFNRWRKARV